VAERGQCEGMNDTPSTKTARRKTSVSSYLNVWSLRPVMKGRGEPPSEYPGAPNPKSQIGLHSLFGIIDAASLHASSPTSILPP
jgi:hypothetical protein